MGSWNYSSIGVSVDRNNENNKLLKEQLMECLGFTEPGWEKHNYGIYNADIDFNCETYDARNILALFNTIIGYTDVYCSNEEGSSVVDWYHTCEDAFHPDGKVETYERDICYGDDTAFGMTVFALKYKTLERKAKRAGIEPAWVDEYQKPVNTHEEDFDIEEYPMLYPDASNYEFYEMCEEFAMTVDTEAFAVKTGHYTIKVPKVGKKQLNELLKEAEKHGYTELAELIKDAKEKLN